MFSVLTYCPSLSHHEYFPFAPRPHATATAVVPAQHAILLFSPIPAVWVGCTPLWVPTRCQSGVSSALGCCMTPCSPVPCLDFECSVCFHSWNPEALCFLKDSDTFAPHPTLLFNYQGVTDGSSRQDMAATCPVSAPSTQVRMLGEEKEGYRDKPKTTAKLLSIQHLLNGLEPVIMLMLLKRKCKWKICSNLSQKGIKHTPQL